MRLIGTFETEKEAYAFYSFLLKEGIQNVYESYLNAKASDKHYRIWVYDEDDLDMANEWLKQFKEHPGDPKFQNFEPPLASTPSPPPDYAQSSEPGQQRWQAVQSIQIKEHRLSLLMTNLVIVICAFLFLWNNFQEEAIFKKAGPVGVQFALTPIMKALFFELPSSYAYVEEAIDKFSLKDYKDEQEIPIAARSLLKKAEEVPSWRGVYDLFLTAKKQGWESAEKIPMFENVRQGQIWRLFTPCLLHKDFLHILFNMVWAWILIKQVEQRISRYKLCLLILVIGIVSNVAQYLMSGPYFLGFSGVVVGLAGFIWMRQKKAPWEGYPLKKGMVLFLLFFIIAMFALELFTFGLKLFSVVEMTPSIANTAHIVGGLSGIILARMPFFRRKMV